MFLTVTDVSKTCAVVIFRAKVSCTVRQLIILNSGIDLIGHRSHDVIGRLSIKP